MIGKEGWSIRMYQIGVDIGGTFTDAVPRVGGSHHEYMRQAA